MSPRWVVSEVWWSPKSKHRRNLQNTGRNPSCLDVACFGNNIIASMSFSFYMGLLSEGERGEQTDGKTTCLKPVAQWFTTVIHVQLTESTVQIKHNLLQRDWLPSSLRIKLLAQVGDDWRTIPWERFVWYDWSIILAWAWAMTWLQPLCWVLI